MNHRPQAPQPVDGDVVILCASGRDAKCSVRQVPKDPQFTVDSRARGVKLLRTFARRQVVDLWCSDPEGSYLIEHNRRAG